MDWTKFLHKPRLMPKWVWGIFTAAIIASVFSCQAFMFMVILISTVIQVVMMVVFGSVVGAVLNRLGLKSFAIGGKNGIFSYVIGAVLLVCISYWLFGAAPAPLISDFIFELHGPIV